MQLRIAGALRNMHSGAIVLSDLMSIRPVGKGCPPSLRGVPCFINVGVIAEITVLPFQYSGVEKT